MQNLWLFLESLFQSLLFMLTRPSAPIAPVAGSAPVDKTAVLAQLIESRTIALGPMPRTGGVLHTVTKEQAPIIAGIIIASAAKHGLRLSLLQALLDGESRDDASAVDPNDQLAAAGEDARAAFLHTDYGIEQEDGSTAATDPQFKGLTTAEIIAKLYDPKYGVDFAASTLASNIAQAKAAFRADPSLAACVPNGDPNVLGCNAYNAGFAGSMHVARTNGVKGNWAYGLGVVTKASGWAALLDG